MDSIQTSLADIATSPEKFSGSDFDKVQAALDYALTNNVAIKFAKMYDITGHTLLINRPQNYFATDRKQLYLIGVSGGIKKTDSGFIFDATYANTGDINVSNMKFESVKNAGTKVWNGDQIIRVKSSNNQYINVDTILSAPTLYTQSMTFVNEHITGGGAWLFEALRYIDVTVDHCLVEDGTNFIRNISALNQGMCNNLRIINNLLENLSGVVLQLGGFYGGEISNNYVEYCGSYFDLSTLATSYPHIGLTIKGNVFYQTSAQQTAQTPSIKIKNINNNATLGNGGLFSSGNVCAGSVLYDLTGCGTSEFIGGIGDNGTILNPSQYIQLGKKYIQGLSDGWVKNSFGNVTNYSVQVFMSLVPASSDQTLTIPITTFTLGKYAIVNVMQQSPYFIIKNVVADYAGQQIIITVTNTFASAALNCSPRIVITDYGLTD
jgi:hypothetical protein